MEENEVLVKVENLSKKFCKDLKTSLWYGVQDLCSNILGNNNNDLQELRPKEFWAVKNINFELRRGECLGLIGHNGAGKSTLLKILNGLINPDEGRVTMKGRICALIELGAGFNPILTGRENIYNNGAILGFSKKEIDSKVEEIIDFAEIREFIDMPVQNYSSGMKVRLGFAVAAQMEPDVLIIDEVLAVGDASFRTKCFNRMSELSSKSVLIFVTHAMPLAGRICTRGLLMEKGIVKIDDNISDVIYEYMINQSSGMQRIAAEYQLDFFKVELETTILNYSDDLNVNLSFKMNEEVERFFINYTILDQEQKAIYQSFSIVDNDVIINTKQVMNCFLSIKKIDLANGKYFMNIGFIENDIRGKNICRYDSAAEFIVKGGKFNSFASILKESTWGIQMLD